MYVDISRVLPHKRAMLAHHHSQKDWLDRTQGMDSYLQAMEDMSRMTKRNAIPDAEKAPQSFIPVPEGTLQLETGT